MKDYNGVEYAGVTMDVDKVRQLVAEKINNLNDIEQITKEIVNHLTIDLNEAPSEKEIVDAVFLAIEKFHWSIDDFLQNTDDTLIFNLVLEV